MINHPRITALRLAGWMAILAALPVGATAPPESRIHREETTPQARPARPSLLIAPQSTVENGLLCTTNTFEGVGNLSPLPSFEGITSPDWLGIIDADAGGTGNIAFEPSPQTVAFWLGGETGTGSSRDIVFTEPNAVVEFFYSSFVTVRLEAFDQNGILLTTASGGSNFNRGPGGDPEGQYNKWDRLRLEVSENRIVRVRVSGAVNQTAIDNLKICRRLGLDTVEFTQAIQEIQDLEDLENDLRGDGQPPVPLVRNKPAALRVYFREVQAVTRITVEAKIGAATQTQTLDLQPRCNRDRQRERLGGCRSADFYFTPSTANLTVDLIFKDNAGRQIETRRFDLRTREAEPLILSAVRVCDDRNANGAWLCADDYLTRLGALVQFLRKVAPTATVRVEDSGEAIRRDGIDADGDGNVTDTEQYGWWTAVASDIDDLYDLFDGIRDLLGIEDRRFYGMTRPTIPGGIQGIADDISSRGALSRTQATLRQQDASQQVVAHETFHTMGRRHTDTSDPSSFCHRARDSGTDWPFSDNRLRSGTRNSNRLEIGFDVANRSPLPAPTTFEVMSYCMPMWISPFTYREVLNDALGKSAVRKVAGRATVLGSFWLVRGKITGNAALLEPLFELVTGGPNEAGTGAYRIEIRNATGGVLFTRRFEPSTPEVLVDGDDLDREAPPSFSELIPVQAGAARIVVLGPTGSTLASGALTGVPPAVTITSPQGGETWSGGQTITWQVTDPDSSDHTFWVQYSPSGGTLGSWQTLGFVQGNRLRLNFDELPGTATTSVIRVLSSDGLRSGTATSAGFNVPKKGPAVEIQFPREGAIFQSTELVWLQGAGFDAEDGALDQLSWRSDRDGVLGQGASLPLTGLSPGTHVVTLTGTDSEDKTASRQVRFVVAGAGPTLDLNVEALDTLPTTCVEVTLNARPGSVGLDRAEYSLDGGLQWTRVAPASLPFRFIVPGQGFFHLVARTFDVSGQLAAEDARFFTDAACAQSTPPPPPGPWLTTGALPGFRFKVQITADGQALPGVAERDCIGETLCISGNLPGRSELFARVIGPRPNGRLWVNLVRFTTSEVEVWIEQPTAGLINYYRLPGLARDSSVLTGLVDKEAFLPAGAERQAGGLHSREPGDPGVILTTHTPESGRPRLTTAGATFTSPKFPDFRFTVRIFSGNNELTARQESDCLAETVCVSGALPGRSELFLRLIGPRPNGFLWVNLVRFTTSRVEVEVEQISNRRNRKVYILPEIPRDSSSLDGLVDKEAFRP